MCEDYAWGYVKINCNPRRFEEEGFVPGYEGIHRVALIGSGPIIIGQACEFDYSGTQACKALREEGIEVILINSNPATIMTDPGMADRTYIEPLTFRSVVRILERERPDGLLVTMGGQTALNLARELEREGVLDELGIQLLGARIESIEIAENREKFREIMKNHGLDVPRSGSVRDVKDGIDLAEKMDFPVILRPSYTLGGEGSAVVFNREEFPHALKTALTLSPIHEVLIEEYLEGWKEFEMEVMRDRYDNAIIVCSIENIDPMGIHTGDSITVAPAQTLHDVLYQQMRDQAIQVLRIVGVETGGANVQFAVHPDTGRMVVIEMNPRVSRSSALASKATGYPIARIATKLALGYGLHELKNELTMTTSACFEPSLDYVVVKIPRWDFQKFPHAQDLLGTSMKSVGEVMAPGRTFPEALARALRSLEIDINVLHNLISRKVTLEELERKLRFPSWDRIFYIMYALQIGWEADRIHRLTAIDPWFIQQIRRLVDIESRLHRFTLATVPDELLRTAKNLGLGNDELARIFRTDETSVQGTLKEREIRYGFRCVDTCAGEFPARSSYFYGGYGIHNEAHPEKRGQSVLVIGSGPNRIGQGIEFDYCCVKAIQTLRRLGYRALMANCNPETVSTDYDISDRLYFEPLTLENVVHIYENEKPLGVFIQFGGQTPLKLALALEKMGVHILGTSPSAIQKAEDRESFARLMNKLGLRHPRFGTARSLEEARAIAQDVGYPVLIRPSYVLGGRAMAKVFHDQQLEQLFQEALLVSHQAPVLIDHFLEDAFEYDLDAVSDGEDVFIGGILQHIEEAGIHSGDSAMVLPAFKLKPEVRELMIEWTRAIARALPVRGLLNIQFAYRDGELYILEVNPRASRTVPFISKATGIDLVDIATRIGLGRSLRELGLRGEAHVPCFAVKFPVFPFRRFLDEPPSLGPEMKSTGEVMGLGESYGEAMAKAFLAGGVPPPLAGNVLITVNDRDKSSIPPLARAFHELGFGLVATEGTARVIRDSRLPVRIVRKIHEGRPHIADEIINGKIQLIVNTPMGSEAYKDEPIVTMTALKCHVPCITTLSGAWAMVEAIQTLKQKHLEPLCLQDIHTVQKPVH